VARFDITHRGTLKQYNQLLYPSNTTYTGLFEMTVGVLATCHTQ